jgi:O-methyltransferase domain
LPVSLHAVIQRSVIPEILDHLPADDPRAIRCRRDLRMLNFLMGNEAWIMRTLRKFSRQAECGIADIGAGDGFLTQKLSAAFPRAAVAAYDLAPRPAHLAARITWHQGDLFTKPAPAEGGVLVANLFIHHFEEEALIELGKWLQGFQMLVFCEPDRGLLPHVLAWLMLPFVNDVTRHDMRVSITAGFAAGELAELLGLDSAHWHIHESSSWRGTRRMVALRD